MFFSSLMETLFYLGLGIAFFLILFLVYLFKQRIINLERKNDTMFDILSTMIKEINTIRCNMCNNIFNENITIEKEDIGIDFNVVDDDVVEDDYVEDDVVEDDVVEDDVVEDDYIEDFCEDVVKPEIKIVILNTEIENINTATDILDDDNDDNFGISGNDIVEDTLEEVVVVEAKPQNINVVDAVVAGDDVTDTAPAPAAPRVEAEIKTEDFDEEDGISVFSELDKTGALNLQSNINHKYTHLRVSALKKIILHKFPDTDVNKMKKGELIKMLE